MKNAETIGGNIEFASTDGLTETGHAGNGHVRIQVLDVKGETKAKIKKKYTPLSHVVNDGTAYFLLDFYPSNLTRVVMDFESTDTGTNGVFGARNANTTATFVLWQMSATNFRSDFAAASGTSTSMTSINDRVVFNKNKNVFTYTKSDSTTGTYTNTAGTFSCSYPLCLMSVNSAGTVDERICSGNLYSCKVYENDVLCYDLIPAEVGGVVGLFDKVSKTFLAPTAGTLTAGTASEEVEVETWAVAEYKARTEDAYEELEYIEATGTQYIETGFVPNQDTRIVAKIKVPVSDSSNYVLGTRTSATSNTLTFAASQNGYYVFGYGTVSNNLSADYNQSDVFTLDINKNVISINEEVAYTATASTFTCPSNMLIFAVDTAGTIQAPGTKSLYSCQIYDNGTLVRDFVPVKSPYGVVGLLDKLNGVFYPNAGTGKFVAGTSTGAVHKVQAWKPVIQIYTKTASGEWR